MQNFITKHAKGIFFSVLAACIIYTAVYKYISSYYHADAVALEALNSDKVVTVAQDKSNRIVTFAPDVPSKALIFYPGGKVEYTAYAPLLHELAQNGYLCILIHMPGNLAVLDKNAADGLVDAYQKDYPSIHEWYIGGHSLGGAMAATYASENSDDFDGLYLFASYSVSDISNSGLEVYSIYGSNDGVLDINKYEKYYNNLPDNTHECIIEGGCHSYFGSYGLQKGDNPPELTAKEQLQTTIDFIR